MKNNGKDAEAGWLAIVKRNGGIVERFWDQADLRGRNGGKAVGAFAQPSDFLLTLRGLLEFAEVKSTTDRGGFSFGKLQPAQSSCALRQARVNGPYNFYIFSYHLSQWFVMPCKQYAAVLDEGRKSVKFKELAPWNLSLT